MSVPAESVSLEAFLQTIPLASGHPSGHLNVPKITPEPERSAFEQLKAILYAVNNNHQINSITLGDLAKDKELLEVVKTEVFSEFLSDLINKSRSRNSTANLLFNIQKQLDIPHEMFERLQNELIISTLKKKSIVNYPITLNTLIKHPKQLEVFRTALSAALADRDWHLCGLGPELNINISELEPAKLEGLGLLFASIGLQRLTITSNNVEQDYKIAMELIGQLQHSSTPTFELRLAGFFGRLPFEQFKAFLSSVLTIPNLQKLDLNQTELGQIEDSQLVALSKEFGKAKRLYSLDLAGNGFEKRKCSVVSAFVEPIMTPSMHSISLWRDVEIASVNLNGVEGHHFAGLMLRLLPKMATSYNPSPLMGFGLSKTEEFAYLTQFIKENVEYVSRIREWIKSFSDAEQQSVLARTYLEAGGSIEGLEFFDLTADMGDILKICLDRISACTGCFGIPNLKMKSGKINFNAFKLMLGEALKNNKITSIRLLKFKDNAEFSEMLNSEEFSQFLVEIFNQTQVSYNTLVNLLSDLQSYGLNESSFERISNAITILSLQKPRQLQLTEPPLRISVASFLKYPDQFSTLASAMSVVGTDTQKFEFDIDITRLTMFQLQQLWELLNRPSLSGRVHELRITFGEKDESKKIAELVTQLKNASIGTLSLVGKFERLPFQPFIWIFQSISKASWVHRLDLPSNMLQHLDDSELLNFAECFKGNQHVESLYLPGNNLKRRNHEVLKKFIECMVGLPRLKTLRLWNADEALPESWGPQDRQKFAGLVFQLLPLMQPEPNSPFLGLISKQEECDYFCRHIRETQGSHLVLGWIKDFSYEQRLTLAETSLQVDDQDETEPFLKPFDLKKEDRLNIFLLFGAKYLPNFLHSFKETESGGLDIFNCAFSGHVFIDAWKTLDALPGEDAADDEFDYDALKADMIGKLIPALAQVNKKYWRGSTFYQNCFDKITVKRKDFVSAETISIYNWAQLLQWYTWCMCRLTTLNIEDLSILSSVLKEIAGYADPGMRYKLSEILFEVMKTKNGQQLFSKLIKKPAPFFIPEIVLCGIVLNITPERSLKSEDIKERKETKERAESELGLIALAEEILDLLTNQYDSGNNIRPFISALHALSAPMALSAGEKLLIIKTLLRPDPMRLGFVQTIETFFKEFKSKKSFALKAALIKLLGDDAGTVLSIFNRYFAADQDLTPREINAISRGVVNSVSSLQGRRELQAQISHWYLISGLSSLTEIESLSRIQPSEYRQTIYGVMQRLFGLESHHMALYPSTFATQRNEAALLTYLGSVRRLKGDERQKVEGMYVSFVRSVLTEGQHLFYGERYNKKSQQHLAVVFDRFPHLEEMWPQNQTVDFNEFVKTNNINFKPFKPDYAKFFMNKIYQNRHLAPDDYPDLRQYLDNIQDEKVRNEIKRRLEEALEKLKDSSASESPDPTKIQLRLLVQLALIRLLETEAERKNIKESEQQVLNGNQKKCIYSVMGYLRKLSEGREFQDDLRGLLRGFEIARRPLDLTQSKNWTLRFTDDYWDLFMCGTDRRVESCQNVGRSSHYNKCLTAYMWRGNIKLIEIKDDKAGELIARRIGRLMLDEVAGRPVLYSEEVYPHFLDSESLQAIDRFAELLADDLGIDLVFDETTGTSVKYPNPLVCLSGPGGPEYVDAIHGIVEDGVFNVPSSQMLPKPKPRDLSLMPALHFNWKKKQGSSLGAAFEKKKAAEHHMVSTPLRVEIFSESSGWEELRAREKDEIAATAAPLVFSQGLTAAVQPPAVAPPLAAALDGTPEKERQVSAGFAAMISCMLGN